MAVSVGTVEAVLKLKDEFTSSIGKATQALGTAGKKAEQIGQSMKDVGGKLTSYITLPIAGVGIAATKMFTDFEGSLLKIENLVGISRDTLDDWQDDILALAGDTAKAPRELADGMFFVTSAGLRGKDALDALRSAAEASALGLGEVTTVADATTSAMNAYGPEVLSASEATNILALAVRAGKLEASALAPVMGRLLPTASAMGISFQQVAGILAVMSRTGLDAAEASTSLSAVMTTLLKPGVQAAKALDSVHLSMADLRQQARGPTGLIDVMRTLDSAFRGNDEALAQVVPNVRAFRGVMNVLAQDTAVVDDVMSQVASGVDVLGEGMERLHDDAGFKIAKFFNDLKVILIDLGGAVVPVLTDLLDNYGARLVEWVRSAVGWFRDLPEPVQRVSIILAGLAAAAGPVLVVVGGLVAAFGAAAAALPAIGTALATVGGAFASVLGVLTSWPVILGAIILAIKPVRDFLIDLGGKILDAARISFQQSIDVIKHWWVETETARKFLVELAKVISGDVISGINKLISIARAVISNMYDWERVTQFVKVAIAILRIELQAVYDRFVELTDQVSGMASGFDIMLEVLKRLNPSMAIGISQLQDWIKEAKNSIKAEDDMAISTAAMDKALRDSTESAEYLKFVEEELSQAVKDTNKSVDTAIGNFASFISQHDELSTKISELKDKIKSIKEASEVNIMVDMDFSEESKELTEILINQISGNNPLSLDIEFDGSLPPWWPTNEWMDSFSTDISDRFRELGTGIFSDAGLLKTAVADIFGDEAIDSLSGFVDIFSSSFSRATDSGLGFVDSLKEGWQGMVDSLSGTMTGFLSGLNAAMDNTWGNIATGFASMAANLASGNVLGGVLAGVGAGLGLIKKLFGSNKRSIDEVRKSFQGFLQDVYAGTDAVTSMGQALYDFRELVSRDTAAASIEFRDNFGDVVDSVISDIAGLQDSVTGTFEAFAGINFVSNMIYQAMFGQFGADVIAQELDKAKNKFFEVMDDMKAFMAEQSEAILTGLLNSFSDFANASASEIEFAETSVLQAFNTMLDAGVPIIDLIGKFSPIFSDISDRAAALGIEIPEEFSRIGEVFNILSNEHLQSVIDKLVGIGEVAVAAGNLGILTAEQYDFLGDKARNAYNQLIAGGLESNEALAALAPTLQQLHDLQELYGYEIDASTQGLLDQAIAQGLVSEKGLDTNDILINGFERVLEALNQLISALGGVPVVFEGWIDSVEEAERRLRGPLRDIRDDIGAIGDEARQAGQSIGSMGAGGGGGFSGEGGRDKGGGYQHGSGGFIDFGTESIVAVHGNEQIITESQGESVAAMVASAIQSASSGGGDNNRESIQLLREQNSLLMAMVGALQTQNSNMLGLAARSRTGK